MLRLAAGSDATSLFESHHPLYAETFLPQFLIGTVSDAVDVKDTTLIWPTYPQKSAFYRVLKERVEFHFSRYKVGPWQLTDSKVKFDLIFN